MREPKTSPNGGPDGSDECGAIVRHRPNFASDELRKQAALYFANGWGYKKTARTLGLPVNTVRDWNRAYKKGAFNLKMSCFVYDEDFKQSVKAMRRAGASWREIQEKTGVSPTTVKRWLARDDDTSRTVVDNEESAGI